MSNDWQMIPLEELTTAPVTYGIVKPGEEDPSGVLFIRGGDIADGRVQVDKLRTVSRIVSDQHRRTLLRGGEQIVSLVGNPGQVAIVPPELAGANIARQVGLVRLVPSVDTRFIKYFLASPLGQSSLGSHSLGSVQQVINLRDLKTVKVPTPPLREQQAIACILGALDDKIELNRRRNRTLEAMARAIFQSWFVDFDPVRQKSEVRRVKGKIDDSAFPSHFKLFPSNFEDSPLGPIPAGWRERSLPEVCEVNPTRSLPKGTVAPYLDMANMPTQGPSPETWVLREMGSGMKFINGDTLVARITPCLENGKTAYVDFLADGQVGWGSTEYIVLRPRGVIPPAFAYLLARTMDFRNFAIQQMTGSSGRQRVPADSLSKYKLVTPEPDDELFAEFGNLIVPMFQSMSAAMNQSRTLAALRDALLPKLISGELRVPDAERIVGRAT
ncbi:MAG: restriction endonuclease subunit S [Gemmataceae bacterium]